MLTDTGGIVEIQGTAERTHSPRHSSSAAGLARHGVDALFEAQREAIGAA